MLFILKLQFKSSQFCVNPFKLQNETGDMSNLRKKLNPHDPHSLSDKFRKKRFRYFLELIKDISLPVKILDVGGTQSFWEQMNFTSPDEVSITILNNETVNVTLPNFKFVKGNATDLYKSDNLEFDVIFSNSVIEHLGSFRNQKKMAEAIIRLGKKYFVQTPNYYFPFEPHFLFPFFQFLPYKIKVFLLMNLNLGWYRKQENKTDAETIINSINLLTRKQLKELFPSSKIIKEKILLLTKSHIVIKLH